MNSLDKLFPIDLYHSYVIEGDPDNLAPQLLKFFENRGDIDEKSTDVLLLKHDSFGMDNVLEVKEWHSQMSVNNKKKFCIISVKFINHDAEQTFLKILEDSNPNTHFFIIVSNSSVLVDTIISRSHVVKHTKDDDLVIKKTSNDFLESKPVDRIKIITQIVEQFKDRENSGGLRYFAIEFINELEKVFYQKFLIDKNNKEIQFVLNEISKSRDYLSTPGASVKMILENIALVI